MIPILYEDGEALVIDKPAGLPVDTPRKGGAALADHYDAPQARIPARAGFRSIVWIQTLRAACCWRRNPKALKRFNRAFEQRLVRKRYLGVVAGEVSGEEGEIDLALAKISSADKGWRMIPAKKGKPSLTRWRTIERRDGLTLVDFELETGRTHQARVHAASGLGLPLLGDPVYGAPRSTRRPAPCCMRSSWVVPREGKPDIAASAPLPSDFMGLGFVTR